MRQILHSIRPHKVPIYLTTDSLTSSKPLWFTLADVLASKILNGKAPKILQAIRFAPLPPQEELQSIMLGTEEIDPVRGDFYRDLINKRRAVKARMDNAAAE